MQGNKSVNSIYCEKQSNILEAVSSKNDGKLPKISFIKF